MKVFFYENEDGCPIVKAWIDDQEAGAKAKIYRDLTLLQEYGLALGMPYIRKIENQIWEIRTSYGGNIYRILFGVVGDAILLHSFQKKTQKTPANEIKTAAKRLQRYLKRK